MSGFSFRFGARTVVAGVLTIVGLLPTCVLAQMNTDPAGGSQAHNNRQPYLGINHIIRLEGGYNEIGEIGLFAGNYAPRGWAFADGQLLPIASHTALFSKIWDTYGGNGTSTFALPDLRGRTMIGVGSGAGLTTRDLADSIGTATTSLTVGQIPSHNHAAEDPVITDFTGGGQPHDNMQPSLALRPLIATGGLFPPSIPASTSPSPGFGVAGSLPFVGEVIYTAVTDDEPPEGWAFADGELLQVASNTALFSLLGTAYGGDGRTTFGLPDLTGRTALHAGHGPGLANRVRGQELGVEQVTLGVNHLPSHKHGGVPTTSTETEATGAGQSHQNIQPSAVVNYIVALQGIYPSPDSASELESGEAAPIDPAAGSGSSPYLGSVSMVAGFFAPDGWALADGQLLLIDQNQSLYSLLGTTYGGDGETTFGLPDLRGRTPVHVGTGPGLTPISQGQKSGDESVYLTSTTMPSHTHLFADMPGPGDANGDGHVDGEDYIIWAANFGTHPGADGDPSDGDYNDDGWIDGLDYVLWAQNFGAGPFDAVAIPEPTSLAMLIIGCAVAGFVRIRSA